MEDQIVYFIITMDWMTPVFGLYFFEKPEHILEMWDGSNRFVGFNIYCFRLCLTDRSECGYLPVVESSRFAEALKRNVFRVDPVKLCQRSNCIAPPA